MLRAIGNIDASFVAIWAMKFAMSKNKWFNQLETMATKGVNFNTCFATNSRYRFPTFTSDTFIKMILVSANIHPFYFLLKKQPNIWLLLKKRSQIHKLMRISQSKHTPKNAILLLPIGGHVYLAEPGCLRTKQALWAVQAKLLKPG